MSGSTPLLLSSPNPPPFLFLSLLLSPLDKALPPLLGEPVEPASQPFVFPNFKLGELRKEPVIRRLCFFLRNHPNQTHSPLDDDASTRSLLRWSSSNAEYMKNTNSTTAPMVPKTKGKNAGDLKKRDDKEKLPGMIPGPFFLADPNHRRKVFTGELTAQAVGDASQAVWWNKKNGCNTARKELCVDIPASQAYRLPHYWISVVHTSYSSLFYIVCSLSLWTYVYSPLNQQHNSDHQDDRPPSGTNRQRRSIAMIDLSGRSK
jgi:hypothetical protein